MFTWSVRSSYLALAVISMLGCSSSDEPIVQPTIPATINLVAAKDINVFEDKLPRPLIVRLYQLRDTGAFDKADFVTIYESDTQVLAQSLVDFKVLSPVIPGEARSLSIDVQKGTKYIAAFAEFADFEVAIAKASIALVEEFEETPILISISQSSIEITQPVESSWWW